MPNAVQNDTIKTDRPATQEEKSGINYYVIGAIVLAMVALLAYQTFGCPDCYAPI